MKFEDNLKFNKVDKSILEKYPIKLLKDKAIITIEEIQEVCGKTEPVIVCDFYLKDIEKKTGADIEDWGLEYQNIINIDHHAPLKRMECFVSSTNLAIDYVKKYGARPETTTVINHTDCDSVLSSAIMKGVIPPEEEFGRAAIMADHTGEENPLADLLQAIEDKRDYDFSLTSLDLLLQGKPLSEEANQLVEKQKQDRIRAKETVDSGKFKFIGSVAYALLEEKIKGSFFPSLLPDCTIIMTASPLKEDPKKLEVKIRLGKKTIENLTLHKLDLDNTPMRFGGRWNAGGNKRSGGTYLNIEECAQIINERLSDFISKQ